MTDRFIEDEMAARDAEAMIENKHGTIIYVGDIIRDPMTQAMRTVERITPHSEREATLHMTDGGVIGAHEVHDRHVFLPSEVS